MECAHPNMTHDQFWDSLGQSGYQITKDLYLIPNHSLVEQLQSIT
jgi:hypothetical protein